jgi:hypothetical protein
MFIYLYNLIISILFGQLILLFIGLAFLFMGIRDVIYYSLFNVWTLIYFISGIVFCYIAFQIRIIVTLTVNKKRYL